MNLKDFEHIFPFGITDLTDSTGNFLYVEINFRFAPASQYDLPGYYNVSQATFNRASKTRKIVNKRQKSGRPLYPRMAFLLIQSKQIRHVYDFLGGKE